ncbi:hypothetical protein GCM10022254_09200 [Actinomadura meridiana]|uniref:Helix-turn-helix domain-containing protein n=1 Tax=Actinomadura meridiana TaxID=559626 RepID=A0ABP8BTM9_9ACTN
MSAAIRWLGTTEVAERLEMSPANVRHLIRAGKLPAQRAGHRLYRVREDHADAYKEARRG